MSPASPADRYLTAKPPGKPRDQKSEIQVSAGQFLLRFEGVSDPCLSPTTQQRVVSSSSQAAYEKNHRQDILNYRHLFSHRSGG